MGKQSSDPSEKVEFWAAAVELFRQSGLSCTDFCTREGLSYSTFCRWRDKLLHRPAKQSPDIGQELSAGPAMSAVDLSDIVEAEDSKFVSAGVVKVGGEQTAGVEVQFSGGVTINVRKDFDRTVFKDVVAILGAELC